MTGLLSDTARDVIALVGLLLGLIQTVLAIVALSQRPRTPSGSVEKGLLGTLIEYVRTGETEIPLAAFVLALQLSVSLAAAMIVPEEFISKDHPLRNMSIWSIITLSYVVCSFVPRGIDDWIREAKPWLLTRWRTIFFSLIGVLCYGAVWSLLRVLTEIDRTAASWTDDPNALVAWLVFQLFGVTVALPVSWLGLLDHVMDSFWEARGVR